MSQNPLSQYFRQFKTYIKLPSQNYYYPAGVVELNDAGELGILAMTAQDEILLQNPDALLNGEAVLEIIKSCVPAVKKPNQLLSNDINALVTAIRHATYQQDVELKSNCPKCKAENTFGIDLGLALENMTLLEPEYSVTTRSGLTVKVKSYGFGDLMKAIRARFEMQKIQTSVESDNLTEEQKIQAFGRSFKEIATIKFEVLASSIVSVSNQDQSMVVTNTQHIKEFLANVEKSDVDLISDLIDEINQIGVERTFQASCQKCQHVWRHDIEFNPTNFS